MKNYIKYTAISCAIFASSTFTVFAQDAISNEDHSTGFSIGYEVGSIANGMAYGLRVASPSFFYDVFRISAAANMGWAQNVIPKDEAKNIWAPYGLYRLGIHAGSFLFDLPIRVSGAAELATVTPSKKISSKAIVMGTVGSMDFEFFADAKRSHALVLNLGGIGLFSPIADNLKDEPSFANGFTSACGYRYYF